MIGGTGGTTRLISTRHLSIGLCSFCRQFLVKKEYSWRSATTKVIQCLRRGINLGVVDRFVETGMFIQKVRQPRCALWHIDPSSFAKRSDCVGPRNTIAVNLGGFDWQRRRVFEFLNPGSVRSRRLRSRPREASPVRQCPRESGGFYRRARSMQLLARRPSQYT